MLAQAAYTLARAWWRVRRPVTVGVRVLLEDDADRVLLVRHRYGTRELHMPGGGVKRGETLAQAAVRETWEETGIALPPDGLRVVGAFTSFAQGKTDHVTMFAAQVHDHEPLLAHNVEIGECAWFAASGLPVDISPATRRRIDEYRAGTLATHTHW